MYVRCAAGWECASARAPAGSARPMVRRSLAVVEFYCCACWLELVSVVAGERGAASDGGVACAAGN